MSRIVIQFSKLGALRYISHLDFQRLWQRLFRMANVDLEETQGFNPRPRLRFAIPLPTGFESQCELLEAFLAETPGDDFLDVINGVCPPGLKLLTAMHVPQEFPKLTALVDALAYRVRLPGGKDVVLKNVSDAVETKTGVVSLSEWVLTSQVEGRDWHLLFKVDNQQTLRPDILAHHYFPGFDAVQFNITRTGIYTGKKLDLLPQGLSLLFD